MNRNQARFQKFAFFTSSTFLLISMLLNITLYRELTKYYKLLYATELNPLGLSYFQDDTNSLLSDKPVVVFYGDSRAAQWIAPQAEGYTFINRGIGNQTSAQVLLRFDKHIQPLHPDVIIIQVCINDMKSIPLFPDLKHGIINDCESNLAGIIQKSLNLNSTVILTTVFPTSGKVPLARRLVWSNDVQEGIEEVNNFIRSYQNNKVIVFDTTRILSDSEGNTKDEYVHDLLHLNSVGYDTLNVELVKILEKLK